jgi:HK97 family phage major capsid protein
MSDIAGAAFPVIFGDMRGYTIVERLGMTIERFHDSYTGVNKVEYHLRRRIGGRVTRPWLFAVMKITD